MVLSNIKDNLNKVIPTLPTVFYSGILILIAIFHIFGKYNVEQNVLDAITVSAFLYSLICLPKLYNSFIDKISYYPWLSSVFKFLIIIVLWVITSRVMFKFNLQLPSKVNNSITIISMALLIFEANRNNEQTSSKNSCKNKSKWGFFLVSSIIVAFLLIGVPIIINEYYKSNNGYVTVWNGADVLGYYGTVLGTIIAVASLGITILFTRKQLKRESVIKNESEKWHQLKLVFLEILDDINPMKILRDVMDNGLTDPTKAINILQRYQMDCRIANDRLNAQLNMDDYPKFKSLIDGIAKISDEFVNISQEGIDQYSDLRTLQHKETAVKMLEVEETHPGSFSEEDITFNKELLEKIKTINYKSINLKISQNNKKYIESYENKYRALLRLVGSTFDALNSETQQKADSMLSFSLWRKN